MSLQDKIPTYAKKELENLLINARKKLGINPDAQAVIEACERELRKFQTKAGFHRRVQEVMEEVAAKHRLMKLPNNVGKDGVCPGGAMIAGWLIAEYYVGFKCPPFRRQAVFAGVIEDRESDIEFWVYDLDHPKVQDGNPPEWLHPDWDLGIPMLRTKDPDEAAEAFKEIIAPYVGGMA